MDIYFKDITLKNFKEIKKDIKKVKKAWNKAKFLEDNFYANMKDFFNLPLKKRKGKLFFLMKKDKVIGITGYYYTDKGKYGLRWSGIVPGEKNKGYGSFMFEMLIKEVKKDMKKRKIKKSSIQELIPVKIDYEYQKELLNFFVFKHGFKIKDTGIFLSTFPQESLRVIKKIKN